MAILITGGKGYLGAEVISRLVSQGEKVVCLDLKTTPGRLGPLAERITMLGGGITGLDQLEIIVREQQIDRIAHMVFFSSSEEEPELHAEIANMVMRTADVYEAARRTNVRRVVFPSSIHYYGPQWLHGEVYLDENAPGLATSVYGIAKKLNEAVAYAYIAHEGLSIISLRLPAVYGPKATVGARGVNIAPVEAALGRPARMPYGPKERVCLAHVEDVAELMVRVLLADTPRHHVYNVGGHDVSYWGLAALVKAVAHDADIRFDGTGRRSDLPYLIDDSRIREEFLVQHRPLRDGYLQLMQFTRQRAGLPPLGRGGGP